LTATLTIEKAELTDIEFNDKTVTYDGEEHKLELENELPEGVGVSYDNNTRTEVGKYNTTAYVDGGNNYENLELNATLTIEKAEITDIEFNDKTVTYDGEEHKIELENEDDLPEGVSVRYDDNTGTEVGEYNATAYIDGGDNYKSLELNAILTIEKTEITDIQLNDKTVTYDGEDHSLKIE